MSGQQIHNQERAARTEAAVKRLMETVVADQVLLLSIIIEGRIEWRNQFRKAFKGLAVDDALADTCYDYFAHRVEGQQPKKLLDKLGGSIQ